MLRSALESLQSHHLIMLNPSEAENYLDYKKSLKPDEVCKKLEEFDDDTDEVRNRNWNIRNTAQIGGYGESQVLEPVRGDKVSYRLGGYIDASLQKVAVKIAIALCGDFIAFTNGVKLQNVDRFRQEVDKLFGKPPADKAFEEIEKLIENLT